MSAPELPHSDIESAGTAPRHHSRRHRSETAGTTVYFSDSDDGNFSWHSTIDSASGGSSAGIEGVSHTHRESCSASDCEVDLESGELERKVHFGKEERDCRICHLNLVAAGSGDGGGGGDAMELGCDCKGDLGAAHKQCAETWFKIKGNTTCEICGTTAVNVAGEQTNEANVTSDTAPAAGAPVGFSESPNTYWQGRRIINILFGCMVLAFVISWLLHFKVLPS